MKLTKKLFITPLLCFLTGCNTSTPTTTLTTNTLSSVLPSSNDATTDTTPPKPMIELTYGVNNTITFGEDLDMNLINFKIDGELTDISKLDASIDAKDMFTNESVNLTVSLKGDSEMKSTIKLYKKERKSLKILFIGNSFSEDTIMYMPSIAESLDVDLKAKNMMIGGCSIDTHYNNLLNDLPKYESLDRINGSWVRTANTNLKDALGEDTWDIVSVQQVSGYSGRSDSYGNLQNLINKAKEYLKEPAKTKFVFNMTWAYQSDSTHADFPYYDNNQMKMYNSILECVKTNVLTKDDIRTVIPNGTAIQNARTSYIGDALTRDGYHLSTDLGRYIASLTAVCSLTGKSPYECLYSPVDTNRTLVAKESIANAIKNKFEITQSSFK